MTIETKVVGAKIREITGFEKVTGQATYNNDIQLPGMLHAKMLRSPHARANIISLDTQAAEALPGVKLVMSHNNFPTIFGPSVNFVGAEVACVVAEEKWIAEKALDLIKVQYEPLPFVIDPEEAIKPGAPQVLPSHPNLVRFPNHQYFSEKNERGLYTKRAVGEFDGYGDVEQGRREAEILYESEGFKFSRAQAPLMSTSGAVASFADGHLTLYVIMQMPYLIRFYLTMKLCKLGFPIQVNKVHIRSLYGGGAFGARIDAGIESPEIGASYSIVTSAATMTLGKPVRLFYSREEEGLYCWGRGSFRSRVAIGFRKDGTLNMMDAELWRNVSRGGLTAEGVQLYDATPTGCMLYSHTCEHTKYVKYAAYTNTPVGVGWQGFGNPEVFLAVESTMDEAAEILGIDPVELRRLNHMRTGDNFLSLTYGHGPEGAYVSRDGISKCINIGVEKVDWASRQAPAEKTGTLRHGKGMALATQQTGGQDMCSHATVKLIADGTATLILNYQELGQGGRTSQTQMVAEVLRLPFERVNIVSGDTDLPFTWLQACSSGTVVNGFATYNAAMDARQKLLAVAAPMIECTPDEVDTENGFVYDKINPQIRIPWIAAFNKLGQNGPSVEIIGHGENRVMPGATPAEQGATFVDLDVDTETGQICNIKVTHVQDCGKAIFPKAVEGDWLGVHHGVEAMVGAEMILDPKTGKLLNDNWIDYPVATILDSDVEPVIVETPCPTHPYGAVGIAQSHQNSLGPAIANAIYNAIGVRLKETPFTPDKILAALGKI